MTQETLTYKVTRHYLFDVDEHTMEEVTIPAPVGYALMTTNVTATNGVVELICTWESIPWMHVSECLVAQSARDDAEGES